MSIHLFANVITPYGAAANNRAETEGNITTLQKLIWRGRAHTTVSAEAIRFAVRRLLADADENGTNRHWNELARANEWEDPKFSGWSANKGKTFIDDDLLGFMTTEGASEEAEGSANVRRAVLEITRAVSLTPWHGDVTFNAASPGATPSASKGENKSKNPVPYGTEVHATRYQYGLALTPERLRDPSRAAKALNAIGSLRTVAGNHGRFLFDFSPEAIVIRVTQDPAPRLLYCFDTNDDGATITVEALTSRIASGDIDPKELFVGVSDLTGSLIETLQSSGVKNITGIKTAVKAACESINNQLGVKG